MAPVPCKAPPRLATSAQVAILALLAFALAASPAEALRLVTYNILNNGGASARDVSYRTILAPLSADVIVLQEVTSQAGVDNFLNNVMNVVEPGQWAAAPFTNGNDTDNAMLYKPAKVQFLGGWGFYADATLLRLINCYRIKPVGYTHESAEIRLYSVHLKASSGSSNEVRRFNEATTIRDSMNAMPPGTHGIVLGDFNIYSGTEPAFGKFLESQVNNTGRLYDPLNAPLITWNTASLAAIHTQSPCLNSPNCISGGATGGLDDRFDMFLPTYNFKDGQALELLPGTYVPVGNDGLHYNLNMDDAPTIPEGAAYAVALVRASDHLPVRVDIQLPAKLLAASSLDLGTVIAGGGADLGVANAATLPADLLDYSFAAPAGFAAPGGSFQAAAGAPANLHAITTTAGAPGPRAGTLVVTSDDPDLGAQNVSLAANVLDHARPSTDSLVVVTTETLDFGTHASGAFGTMLARVHNTGYASTQAKLEVLTGAITGGAGRFSISGGFSPATVAGTAAPYTVAFNDAGATADSLYEALLTFSTSDEALPGATPLAAIVCSLKAQVSSGTVGITDRLPVATVLFAPAPNPLRGASTIRFDLAAETNLSLDVFDLSGRRVATLAQGRHAPGRHAIRWQAEGAGGERLGNGLYFIRLSGAGIPTSTTRIAIVQ